MAEKADRRWARQVRTPPVTPRPAGGAASATAWLRDQARHLQLPPQHVISIHVFTKTQCIASLRTVAGDTASGDTGFWTGVDRLPLPPSPQGRKPSHRANKDFLIIIKKKALYASKASNDAMSRLQPGRVDTLQIHACHAERGCTASCVRA